MIGDRYVAALLGAVVLLAGSSLEAQTTHVVGGPTGLAEIRLATAIAQPGDVILVQPGDYAFFRAVVGVTIRAVVPGSVRVYAKPYQISVPCGTICLLGTNTSFGIPAGQSAHVVGIHFVGNQVPLAGGGAIGSAVVVNGDATFERCIFEAVDKTALTISLSQHVHLQECVVHALGATANVSAAMSIVNANVTAVSCSFRAPDGDSASTGIGVPAIRVFAGRLHASGITAKGGSSANGAAGGVALDVHPSSTAWVSDSTLVAGDLGCAVGAAGGIVTFLDRVVTSETGGPCATGTLYSRLLGVERSGALELGRTFGVTFQANPAEIVGVLGAPETASDASAFLSQWLWLDSTSVLPAAILLADANGRASAAWTVPNAPVLRNQRLWLQGFAGQELPLRTSPPVGGVVR